jgi:hypothetical protein
MQVSDDDYRNRCCGYDTKDFSADAGSGILKSRKQGDLWGGTPYLSEGFALVRGGILPMIHETGYPLP